MNIWKIGLLGEMQAARFLKRQGMRILERRYRAAHGEIDLIAQENHTLVFTEVKCRPKGAMGEGIAAVNSEKRQHIRRAAAIYLQSHPAESIRFDVIEISAAGLRHIKNAF
ncbi:MAG: YraN family protein [Clostridia bacterium]|nr:YraN family protein [Clostridiales bacterium]MBQ2976745.1 YraN family protein [Clostridia bacterium]